MSTNAEDKIFIKTETLIEDYDVLTKLKVDKKDPNNESKEDFNLDRESCDIDAIMKIKVEDDILDNYDAALSKIEEKKRCR